MQLSFSEIAAVMQKQLDAKHDVNLYRKQFGNMESCMKQIKYPYFTIDSMIVKMKGREEIEALKKAH